MNKKNCTDTSFSLKLDDPPLTDPFSSKLLYLVRFNNLTKVILGYSIKSASLFEFFIRLLVSQ